MASAPVPPPSAAVRFWLHAAPKAASAFPHKLRQATISRRQDFLAASAKGKKFVTGTFILLANERPADHPIKDIPRIGYTVTKKMGNAVARNRIKRRLRSALKAASPDMKSMHDYVIISKAKAATCPFSDLARDIAFAFSRITTT